MSFPEKRIRNIALAAALLIVQGAAGAHAVEQKQTAPVDAGTSVSTAGQDALAKHALENEGPDLVFSTGDGQQ